MSECKTNWESVIPNLRKGDVITPFAPYFEKIRQDRANLDGGDVDIDSTIKNYAAVKRADRKKRAYTMQTADVLYRKSLTNANR